MNSKLIHHHSLIHFSVVRSDANVSEEASKLNERATFHCKVKSPDGAAELELWWQNKGENITNTDKIKVTKQTNKHFLSQKKKF